MTKRKDSAEKAILPKWRIVKTTPILRLRASPTEQALPTISRRLEGTANDVVSTSDVGFQGYGFLYVRQTTRGISHMQRQIARDMPTRRQRKMLTAELLIL